MNFTKNEQKVIDFLNEYATEIEIDEISRYVQNEDFDGADKIINIIIQRH